MFGARQHRAALRAVFAFRRHHSAAPALAPAPLSTTHKGNAFEERSRRVLEEHLSMSLRRVGGKDDGGVDLQGWWWLPAPEDPYESAPRMRLRVLAQCKDEKRKLSPKYVRELEGVLFRYLARTSAPAFAQRSGQLESREELDPVVGLLVSSAPYTKATLLRAHSSPLPLVLLHIPTSFGPLPSPGMAADAPSAVQEEEATLGTLLFNPALSSSSGLLRGKILPRWEREAAVSLGSQLRGRPGLWFEGRRIQSWTPENAVEGGVRGLV